MKSTAKIVSIFVLFLATFFIGLLPHGLLRILETKFSGKMMYRRYISVLNCFAGGVFFATAILHLMPESTELLKKVFTIQYPVSGAISGAGFFLLLFIEHSIGTCRGDSGHHLTMESTEIHIGEVELTKVSKNSDHAPSETLDKQTQAEKKLVEIKEHEKTIEQKAHTLSKLRTFVLLLAFSFHMVFEGLALGLENSESGVWSLLGVLGLHKCVVAFSVGLQLSESLRTLRAVLPSLTVFSAVAPVGVVLGFLVTEYGDNENAQVVAAGVLQSLATGTFFYVTFFEILQKELSTEHNLCNVLSTAVGFAVVVGVEFLHDSDE